MKKTIALIVIVLLCIQCSDKLIIQHKKNGIIMEKIDINTVEKLLSNDAEVANISKMVDGAGQEQLMIKSNNNEKEIITTITRHKGELITLSTRSTEDNIEEYKVYYPHTGYLKSKIRFLQETTIQYRDFVIGISARTINSEYYDSNGLLTQDIEFEDIYKYTFENLLQDVINNLKPYYSYFIGMYYLDSTIYPDSSTNVKNELLESGIDIKFHHPYWAIRTVQPDSVGISFIDKTTYIDGVTGDSIGETTLNIKTANH